MKRLFPDIRKTLNHSILIKAERPLSAFIDPARLCLKTVRLEPFVCAQDKLRGAKSKDSP